jgi:5-bromo-4-chloroindolyl phosphate hydrolysis protein
METVDKFLQLFDGFEMLVTPKQEKKQLEPIDQSQKTRTSLNKVLKRLEKEYKQAVKSFKLNKISRNELFDFEWRIFEVREELKRLDRGGV